VRNPGRGPSTRAEGRVHRAGGRRGGAVARGGGVSGWVVERRPTLASGGRYGSSRVRKPGLGPSTRLDSGPSRCRLRCGGGGRSWAAGDGGDGGAEDCEVSDSGRPTDAIGGGGTSSRKDGCGKRSRGGSGQGAAGSIRGTGARGGGGEGVNSGGGGVLVVARSVGAAGGAGSGDGLSGGLAGAGGASSSLSSTGAGPGRASSAEPPAPPVCWSRRSRRSRTRTIIGVQYADGGGPGWS